MFYDIKLIAKVSQKSNLNFNDIFITEHRYLLILVMIYSMKIACVFRVYF